MRCKQRNHTAALAPVRLQQFEHPVVAGACLARERPGDGVLQVIVTNGHGVGVAKCVSESGTDGPRADSGDVAEQLRRVCRFGVVESKEPISVSSYFSQCVCAVPVDSEWMQPPRRLKSEYLG